MTLRPLSDFVVIEPDEKEDRSKGGIFIPETSRKESCYGKAIAVGPGKDDHPMTVKQGDRILYVKRFGSEVEITGKELRIMKESDILAVVENDDDV